MEHYSAESYILFVRQHLDALTQPLVAQLATILRQRFHPRAARLRITVLPEGLAGPLPIQLLMVDGDDSQVLHHNAAFSLCLLPDVAHVVPPAHIETAARYHQAGVETVEVELQTLIEWFIECWDAAGGREFPLAATLGIRGDIEAFDLKRQAWVQDTQAVRQKNRI